MLPTKNLPYRVVLVDFGLAKKHIENGLSRLSARLTRQDGTAELTICIGKVNAPRKSAPGSRIARPVAMA